MSEAFVVILLYLVPIGLVILMNPIINKLTQKKTSLTTFLIGISTYLVAFLIIVIICSALLYFVPLSTDVELSTITL